MGVSTQPLAEQREFAARERIGLEASRVVKVFYPVERPELHPREVLGWLREARSA
jgi:hypothetical protein